MKMKLVFFFGVIWFFCCRLKIFAVLVVINLLNIGRDILCFCIVLLNIMFMQFCRLVILFYVFMMLLVFIFGGYGEWLEIRQLILLLNSFFYMFFWFFRLWIGGEYFVRVLIFLN